jgi:predicted nucleic acid-binding protein
VTAAVTDAGPLIHLTEVGCLELVHIFDILHLPDAVWFETVERGRVPSDVLQKLHVVRRHTIPDTAVERFVQENGLAHLQAGERECLYLRQHINVPTLLTDDLAVRDAAKRLHVTPVGSLGVVVRAYQQSHVTLTEAERHITALYAVSSLFVTRAIVELALEHLAQH